MKSFKSWFEACWDGYKQVGMKKKGDKAVPNCVPEEAPANSVGSGNIAGLGVGPDGEPGVMPGAANLYKKKNKDEFKKRVSQFLTKFKTVKENNDIKVLEIVQQIQNDEKVYTKQIEPILKNLSRKKIKDEYTDEAATKLFRYVVDNKVREVARNANMNSRMIPGTVRNEVATKLLASYNKKIDEYVNTYRPMASMGSQGQFFPRHHRHVSVTAEDWSQKYKDSIDCDNPKGFSQKAHCDGKKKRD